MSCTSPECPVGFGQVVEGKLCFPQGVCEGKWVPRDSNPPEHPAPLKPAQERAAEPAARSSSQLHPVPAMPVGRAQKLKGVWSRDKKFHAVPVVGDGAPG
jgi:hypothetical protein